MARKRKAVEDKAQPIKYSNIWTDKECVDLAYGLQEYGFAETKEIANLVQTKDENTIKQFLSVEATKLRQRCSKKVKLEGKRSSWNSPKPSDLDNWSPLCLWRRVVQDQHLPCVKKHDYSKILLEDLCRTFYEEADDTDDPEIINMKAIYKYLLDSVRGYVPAELSAIDSGVVLILLGQLLEMVRDMDFSEEFSFITNFKKATSFSPFKVKDEFKEKSKKRISAIKNAAQSSSSSTKGENETEVPNTSNSHSQDVKPIEIKKEKVDDDTIFVVEDMYHNLSRHRKMVQSFNPLNVPLWNVVKDQTYVQRKCEEALDPISYQLSHRIYKTEST